MAMANIQCSSVPQEHKNVTGEITPEAVNIICRLPGLQPISLPTWFFSAKVLEENDQQYLDISEYVKNGQCHGYGMRVMNIVRVVKNGMIEFEHDQSYDGKFRMMLWHGTKTNVVSAILQNGFKLPNEHRQMFGPGLYFTDRISKATNHGDQGRKPVPGSKAFLLLCDVSLGRVYNARNPKHGITEAPSSAHFDSVMCTGKWVPERAANREIQNSVLPSGPTIQNTRYKKYTVRFNEYIVYDPDKVRIKYLVEVEFATAPI